MKAAIAAGAALLIGAAEPAAEVPPREGPQGPFPIVELRQYTLHEGQRDALIGLFERAFIESQEALGMKVIGTFIDLDRPDRFVWLRGFIDMDARRTGLTAFYGGPLWLAHRDEANATIADSDNVLLLHAPSAASEFRLGAHRPALGERAPAGLVVATIDYLKGPPAEAASRFATRVRPRLARRGLQLLGWFVSETAPNNFRLPVREGERVLVWFTGFADARDHRAHAAAMAEAAAPLDGLLARAPETLRLMPTPRSLLRGPAGIPAR